MNLLFNQSSSFISSFLKPSLLGKLSPFEENPEKIKKSNFFFLKIQKLFPGTNFSSVCFWYFPHFEFLVSGLWLSLIYMVTWKKFHCWFIYVDSCHSSSTSCSRKCHLFPAKWLKHKKLRYICILNWHE